MLSKETSYSQARANLASILDEVVDQQQILSSNDAMARMLP